MIELSDSFRSAWSDLASELDIGCVQLAAEDAPPPTTVAVIVAGGGEEDRALDLLPSLTWGGDFPMYLVGARPSHRFAVEALRLFQALGDREGVAEVLRVGRRAFPLEPALTWQ